MGYIIIGDSGKFKDCLVKVLYAQSAEQAQTMFQRFLNDPTERCKKDHKNFRLKPTKKEDEWWRDPFLAN